MDQSQEYQPGIHLSEENERPAFKITDDCKAQWAIRKIREAEQSKEMWAYHYQEQLRKLQESLDGDIAYLTFLLETYFDTCPKRTTPTQEKYALPDADLIRKTMTPTYKYDDQQLVEYLKNAGRQNMIKTVEKPMWADFKPFTRVVDGTLVDTETGEIVSAVMVTENPPVFQVKLKDGRVK